MIISSRCDRLLEQVDKLTNSEFEEFIEAVKMTNRGLRYFETRGYWAMSIPIYAGPPTPVKTK